PRLAPDAVSGASIVRPAWTIFSDTRRSATGLRDALTDILAETARADPFGFDGFSARLAAFFALAFIAPALTAARRRDRSPLRELAALGIFAAPARFLAG